MKKLIFGALGLLVLGILIMIFGRWELYVYAQNHTGERGTSLGKAGAYWTKEACQTAGETIVINGYRGYMAKFTCGIGCRGVSLDGHTCLIEE